MQVCCFMNCGQKQIPTKSKQLHFFTTKVINAKPLKIGPNLKLDGDQTIGNLEGVIVSGFTSKAKNPSEKIGLFDLYSSPKKQTFSWFFSEQDIYLVILLMEEIMHHLGSIYIYIRI